MSFTADLDRFIRVTGATADEAVQKVVIMGFQGIQTRTPVDTGRARANWTVSPGSPDLHTTEDTDPSAALSKAQDKTSTLGSKDENIYISNNLPYAMALEYGHSDQAPQGMVRVTAAELQARINAVGGI